MTGFRRVGERHVHQGYVWRVVVAEFVAPDGTVFHRDLVRSPGAVAVVPLSYDDDGTPHVVLVRQYRPAFEAEMWEIPAGMRDVEGEAPELTAERELVEEAGLRPGRLELLTKISPSAGLTDSITWIFLGTDLVATDRDLHGPEEEHMTVVRLPLAEVVAMIELGEVDDAKTVVGVLMTARRLDGATAAGA